MKYLSLLLILGLFVNPVQRISIPQDNTSLAERAPGPPNPYCGKKKRDFLPPVTTCHDGILNQNCIKACKDTYKTTMLNSYNTACTAYDAANSQYVRTIREAISDYDSCVASATNDAQRAECRITLSTAIVIAHETLNSTRDTIGFTVDEDSIGARITYSNCAERCCEH